MKYYLIAGEASGDLHASRLMQSLKDLDHQAEFRFFGGDFMSAVGGTRVRHYRELAYMGVTQIILHLNTILGNMKFCQKDILAWKPDCVILVDYPGFNLRMAKYIKTRTPIRVYYYISPKIWAWKEYRIKSIKKYVDELYSILPFEIPFFEVKHQFPIHYVGNPTAEEVFRFKNEYHESLDDFCSANGLSSKPILAILSGSRKQEIKNNLSRMIAAGAYFPDYQMVIAGAPGISEDYYDAYIKGNDVKIIFGKTYPLLYHSTMALVTSGTATLETAIFRIPQVVCYYTSFGRVMSWLRSWVLHVKYISLVNLVCDKEVVRELVCDGMTVRNCIDALKCILPDTDGRNRMLSDYDKLIAMLGNDIASDCAAKSMVGLLKQS